MEAYSSVWSEAAQNMLNSISEWLPSLIGAFIVLIIGWLVAVLARGITRGLLRRIGLDRVADKSGVSESLDGMNVDRSASNMVGKIVYWLVLLFFVLVALEGLGLTAVTETLGVFVTFLPRVIVAVMVILVGAILARLVGDGLTAFASTHGMTGAMVLGQIVRYVLLVFTAVIALDQLGLDTSLVTSVILLVTATLGFALAIAFGFGTRELAGRIVAGLHAKDTFQIGQRVRVGEHTGTIARIGQVTSILDTEAGQVSIPNDALLGQQVTILTGHDSAETSAGTSMVTKA